VAKRKAKKQDKKFLSSFLFIFSWFVVGLIAIVLLVGVGYYYGYKEGSVAFNNTNQKEIRQLRQQIKKYQNKSKPVHAATTLNKRLQNVLKQNNHDDTLKTAAHEYADGKGRTTTPPPAIKRKVIHSSQRPKLAIIIDDVSFKRDVSAIKKLNIPITMSFLPPSKRHPDSAKLAQHESFYMVHLPLEAMNFSSEEPFTLHVDDSQKEIASRIESIKELFPRVKYINNHTGSKFTSNESSVNRLIYTLRQDGIKFIDSRTTAQTKVPKVMQSYGSTYVARDVFLDHKSNIEYIKNQIQIAVNKAKQHGSAIAIGHPKRETLQALSESKTLFKDVELVRIDGLF
jgi:polysaccharide deacetylase 2 family uncharacterized protein YibQ